MKDLFFLTAFALGMVLGALAYLIGGIALLTTGFTFCFIIVGSLFVMASQLRRVMGSSESLSSGLVANA